MANRAFKKKQALEPEVKDLYAKITIGVTGAPTLTTGIGIESIVRSAQGDYRLTLQDQYYSLKFFYGIHLKSAGEDLVFQLKAETVSSTKLIDFFTNTGATPTDPANGDVLYLKIEVKNTSAI